MTNMCGSGAIFDLVPGSRSTFVRHASEFVPLMFIAQDPQMPSLLHGEIQGIKDNLHSVHSKAPEHFLGPTCKIAERPAWGPFRP